MEDFNIEELVSPYIIENLGEVYRKDGKYQNLLKEEDLLYEKLSEELTDEQVEESEKYFEAAVAAASRKEILAYIQGMKDMYHLFIAMQSGE